MDLEQEVSSSNIDFDLRAEISKAKKPFPKKQIIIISVIVGIIIVALLIYLFAVPKTMDVTFSFFINKEPVTEDLNVQITMDDEVSFYPVVAGKLLTSFPKGAEINLEVLTVGYKISEDFVIEESEYSVNIFKSLDNANLEGQSNENVFFNIYKYPNSINLFNNPVVLNLKCTSSGKSDTVTVTGSYKYSKLSDCGSLYVTGSVLGFKQISQRCDSLCNINLYEEGTVTPTQSVLLSKNDLIVYAVAKKNAKAIKDVEVSVLQNGITISSGKTDENGEIVFNDLTEGTYNVSATMKIGSKILQMNDSVVIVASNDPITKTFEFKVSWSGSGSNGSEGFWILDDSSVALQSLLLTINTFDNADCNVGVDIYNNNGNIIYTGVNDTNETREIVENDKTKFSSPNYINVIPLDECYLKYSPILNKSFKMPEERDLNLTLNEFDNTKFVVLTVQPTKFGQNLTDVDLSVVDSEFSNNQIYSATVEKNPSETEFVLDINKTYTIDANKNELNASKNYKYSPKAAKSDTREILTDNLVIELGNSDLVDVNVLFGYTLRNELTVLKEYTVYYTFDGSELSQADVSSGIAKISVPKGKEVLMYFDYKSEPDTVDNATLTSKRYYLNPVTFTKSQDLNVFFNKQPTSYPKSLKYYPSIYLNASLTVKADDTNLKAGGLYYVPFDVPAKDNIIDSGCVQKNKLGNLDCKKKGFHFFIKDDSLENKIIFKLNSDMLYYFNNDSEYIKSIGAFSTNFYGDKDNVDSTYRVVAPILISDNVEKGTQGVLRFDAYYSTPPYALTSTNEDGNVTFTVGGAKPTSKDPTAAGISPLAYSYNECTADIYTVITNGLSRTNSVTNYIDVNIGKDEKEIQSANIFVYKDTCTNKCYKVSKAEFIPDSTMRIDYKLFSNLFLEQLNLYPTDKLIGLKLNSNGSLDFNLNVNHDILLPVDLPKELNYNLDLTLDETNCIGNVLTTSSTINAETIYRNFKSNIVSSMKTVGQREIGNQIDIQNIIRDNNPSPVDPQVISNNSRIMQNDNVVSEENDYISFAEVSSRANTSERSTNLPSVKSADSKSSASKINNTTKSSNNLQNTSLIDNGISVPDKLSPFGQLIIIVPITFRINKVDLVNENCVNLLLMNSPVNETVTLNVSTLPLNLKLESKCNK